MWLWLSWETRCMYTIMWLQLDLHPTVQSELITTNICDFDSHGRRGVCTLLCDYSLIYIQPFNRSLSPLIFVIVTLICDEVYTIMWLQLDLHPTVQSELITTNICDCDSHGRRGVHYYMIKLIFYSFFIYANQHFPEPNFYDPV